ncbi:hypothetical protein BDV93DRAFT_517136 [Ceratobasidium sp. AG-I]|nr:hypothetical protein BDV93DRAFT_517136 [Ceratobasidium sp. AG-I]
MSALPGPDPHGSLDDDIGVEGGPATYPQLGIGKRPPTTRVSFSRSVRPSRSRINAENNSQATGTGPSLGGGGVPLGERVYSIPESTTRMSMAIPTGLSSPEATPLPFVPLAVLCIAMMGEFLTANVSAPWALFMVESFNVEAADVGLWTGILISVFFISQFLTSLLWANIADRFGRRLVLFVSLMGSGFSCIAFGTSKSLEFAIFTRLLQGVFGGAVGVARGSVSSISDSSNEAQAYAILGFCWGFGGVGGAIIGGAFESPAKKWDLFAHIPLFVELPYLLPTMVAAFVTITGGLLSLTLDRDGGPRMSSSSSGTDESGDSTITAEAGLLTSPRSDQATRDLDSLPRPSALRFAESSLLQQPPTGDPSVGSYGAIGLSTPVVEHRETPAGVPLGERTWTQSSAVSGGSGYGDRYQSRFGAGVRHRHSTTSWASGAARRRAGADDGHGDTYVENEANEREPRLAERILMANELTVTSIGDLWVASALTMEQEDENMDDFEDQLTEAVGGFAEPHYSSALALVLEPRARSVSANRRVAPRNVSLSRDGRPYSLALSANNSTSRFSPYPAIFQNTGLQSPSPAFDMIADAPDAANILGNVSGGNVLQPIIEGKPVGYEAQEAELSKESLFSQLPLVIIFQYGLLGLHSTVHDQVFMTYLVSKSDRGGLQLDAGDFAQLIAMMCLAQMFYQFYLYPTMGPPLGRFSHLSMFRIGGVLLIFSYVSVIFVRPFAKSGASGGMVMTALGLSTAVRYCGITFSYTSATVLLNYLSPPHAVGLANGLAQSVISLARFLGPLLGGYIWSFSTHADPEGYAFVFWFCAAFCILALLHSFTLR